ncbi:cyclic nucleotide-binding domain-containing protein [Muricauda sp. JGD-17]|uniref:Cyclic nucleotide-binding domain-containing protein n=1 Tax=Flagellimonas ochracea TaxID=2696472 RepID=A0A964WX60_9FLAO|nr:cyclic nucleotide-binding domain-containing protein [Allomuricauda ochracea]
MKEFINNIHHINQDVLDEYINQWVYKKVSKKTLLTSAGQTERFIYFIVKGACKSYYLNNGKEHVMFFGYEPSFCGVIESFLTQTPSKYYLETISDCVFYRLPYSVHEEYLKKHREIERLFRISTEQFLVGIIERHHELMALSAKARFLNFMDRSPHLLRIASQKDIASYLRIDPTNFSKFMNSEQG